MNALSPRTRQCSRGIIFKEFLPAAKIGFIDNFSYFRTQLDTCSHRRIPRAANRPRHAPYVADQPKPTMKQYFITLAIMALTATIPAAAQQPQGKLLTMEETILSRELSPASYPVRWVAQSDSYSITDGTAIVAVNARSGKRSTVITLEELNRLLSADFKAFPAYSFEDENTLVVISNGVRSTIDLRRSSIVASSRVPEGVANLTRQPGKGGRYAYTRANNLYYFDGENEHAVTEYEDRSIVCGQSVSRNEFGITGGIFFAPDASETFDCRSSRLCRDAAGRSCRCLS